MQSSTSYLANVLAFELLEERLETLLIRFDADSAEDAFDVLGRRRGVAGEAEEEVCCEVLHVDYCYLNISVLFEWSPSCVRTVLVG